MKLAQPKRLRDLVAAAIRTYTPYAITWALTALGRWLGDWTPDPGLQALLIAGGGSLLHGIVSILEQKWPWIGWLLGLPVPPTYQLSGSLDQPDGGSS